MIGLGEASNDMPEAGVLTGGPAVRVASLGWIDQAPSDLAAAGHDESWDEHIQCTRDKARRGRFGLWGRACAWVAGGIDRGIGEGVGMGFGIGEVACKAGGAGGERLGFRGLLSVLHLSSMRLALWKRDGRGFWVRGLPDSRARLGGGIGRGIDERVGMGFGIGQAKAARRAGGPLTGVGGGMMPGLRLVFGGGGGGLAPTLRLFRILSILALAALSGAANAEDIHLTDISSTDQKLDSILAIKIGECLKSHLKEAGDTPFAIISTTCVSEVHETCTGISGTGIQVQRECWDTEYLVWKNLRETNLATLASPDNIWASSPEVSEIIVSSDKAWQLQSDLDCKFLSMRQEESQISIDQGYICAVESEALRAIQYSTWLLK